MKIIIFHLPDYIDLNLSSGSQIRPQKMIKAFENCGYRVDLISGYGKERKAAIKKIRKNIASGIKYDFIYSESSSTPTMLTEKHHLPLYWHLDFNFLSFCNKQMIPICLFYRDIYWKFDFYKNSISFIKRLFATFFYKYDLYKYQLNIDLLYLPSIRMAKYLSNITKPIINALPPAIININKLPLVNISGIINIFYVGGIGAIYNMHKLFEVVRKMPQIQLTICCRKIEWEQQHSYKCLLSSNIQIIHEKNEKLIEYYQKSDVVSMFFEPHEYRTFAMPIKLFESIGYHRPIIVTKNSAVSDFVEKFDIGWSIPYDNNSLEELLYSLLKDKAQISEKIKNIEKIINENTWENRIHQIEEDIKKIHINIKK
jgi:glycosyltransferase involved in cell wall biosynthesis